MFSLAPLPVNPINRLPNSVESASTLYLNDDLLNFCPTFSSDSSLLFTWPIAGLTVFPPLISISIHREIKEKLYFPYPKLLKHKTNNTEIQVLLFGILGPLLLCLCHFSTCPRVLSFAFSWTQLLLIHLHMFSSYPLLLWSLPHLFHGQSQMVFHAAFLSWSPREMSSLIFCSTLYFSQATYHSLSFICFIFALFLTLWRQEWHLQHSSVIPQHFTHKCRCVYY